MKKTFWSLATIVTLAASPCFAGEGLAISLHAVEHAKRLQGQAKTQVATATDPAVAITQASDTAWQGCGGTAISKATAHGSAVAASWDRIPLADSTTIAASSDGKATFKYRLSSPQDSLHSMKLSPMPPTELLLSSVPDPETQAKPSDYLGGLRYTGGWAIYWRSTLSHLP